MASAVKEFLLYTDDRLRAGEIGRSHQVNTEQVCRMYVVPQLGMVLLNELSIERVATFARQLRHKGLASASVRKAMAVLRRIEKFARKRGWMKAQPVLDALGEFRAPKAEKIETFTPAEVTKLLAKAGERRHQMNARPTASMNLIVHLAALCGMRVGEILGLPVSAIDLDRRQIDVRQALSRFYEIKGPKTSAGYRPIPMPSRVVALVRDWMEHHHIENEHGLLLTSPSGLPIRQSNLRERWYNLLDACAMPRRHFHALRHFNASWLIAHGMPAPEVAKLLGHAQFDMTLRVYTHGLLDQHAQAERVERIMGSMVPVAATEPHGLLTH